MKTDYGRASSLLTNVIPAKAGIQYFQQVLDPGFRRGDVFRGALVILSLLFIGCGGDFNASDGEDFGNVLNGTSGMILTQAEHPIGWGQNDCFMCHYIENIHREDRDGTGAIDIEIVRERAETEGLAGCVRCHLP